MIAGLVLRQVLRTVGGESAELGAELAGWVAFLLPVAYAFSLSRPRFLLEFRLADILWGVAGGVALRAVQGVLSNANSRAFPELPADSSEAFGRVALDYLIRSVFVAPVLEEFLFRGVLLVCVFQIFRASLGPMAASVTAVLVSAGAFVLVHAAGAPLGLAGSLQLLLFGACAASLVLLTGRIWGTVLLHAVYNLSFLVLVGVEYLAESVGRLLS